MSELKKVQVSVVIPVYSGESYLFDLVSRLEDMRRVWLEHESPVAMSEAIFVNDAAIDGSLGILYELQKSRPWIRVINLSRNYGQHQASVAGILHSSGDWVVTLDEDLQHDPLFIDAMLKKAILMEQDVVYASPENGAHASVIRDYSSKLFKKTASVLSGNKHVVKFNSYRLIRGTVARAAASVSSHGAYYDMVLCWFSDRLVSIVLPIVDIRYMNTGKSGYSIRTLLSHARKMLINSEAKIIRVGAGIGFFSLAIFLILGMNVFFNKLLMPDLIPIEGWASLFLSILFFGGLIAVLLGVVLEYISVVLLHIQGKPAFFIVDRRKDKTLRDFYRIEK